ncbi:5-deoxy-glucuronate isomerase [Nocardioides mesophilus]|uniref:5-deoxy-glucuronate isomerase n=1 Tax=Nocardioides mesophilus TaxID=433659 RepID=A0A7G9RDT9_9ACTN|nr:5-deoxy-glucuronate isomerase [Nocardioides mesophilus]QNN53764.1 5-deoxy-glucuronate isomerase [Nocardioides mesophilus]
MTGPVGGHHLRAGSAAGEGFDLLVTPESAGWGYSGLAVLSLDPGQSARVATGDSEMLVLPLSGACEVACDGERVSLAGRPDVFAHPTDFVYLPRDAVAEVTSAHGGRFALPAARCERRLSVRHQPAAAVPVELRGAGRASRQVNNFCAPEAFDADRLIACEVLTPGGNWSSYPPHKHDEESQTESRLEEIYYFEVADGPAGPGMGYQRVYASPGKEIDVLAEVRSGDVVLVPHGWHGPSMAVPGYDLYYLNVMAGPGDTRAWLIRDDPAHRWVRDTWADQPVDPRLPFGRNGEEER